MFALFRKTEANESGGSTSEAAAKPPAAAPSPTPSVAKPTPPPTAPAATAPKPTSSAPAAKPVAAPSAPAAKPATPAAAPPKPATPPPAPPQAKPALPAAAPAAAPAKPAATPVPAPKPAAPASPTNAPAPAAAPKPAAAPAPAAPPNWAKELAEKLSGLAKVLETEQATIKAFTERMKQMEDRVSALQHLSEFISMRYNPFLDTPDRAAFQDDARPVVRATNGGSGRGAPAPAPTAAPAAPPVSYAPAPNVPQDTPPRPTSTTGNPYEAALRAATPQPSLAGDPRSTVPAGRVALRGGASRQELEAILKDELAALQAESAPARPAAPVARPAFSTPELRGDLRFQPMAGSPAGPGHGVRESYLALVWFDYLARAVNPPSVYPFLDYYREVGWLTEDAYQWFCRLAEGIAPRRDNEDWSGFFSDPRKLARIHLGSLRFLDYIFRSNLYKGEAGQLEQTVKDLFESG